MVAFSLSWETSRAREKKQEAALQEMWRRKLKPKNRMAQRVEAAVELVSEQPSWRQVR